MHNAVRRSIAVLFCSLFAMSIVFSSTNCAHADEGKVTLGAFVLQGLQANYSEEERPEWFRQFADHNKDLVNRKPISLEVTRDQAAEITSLFSDNLTPLMYTPEEATWMVGDMRGLEYLINLETFGHHPDTEDGLWWQPFSREQIDVLYRPIVDYFSTRETEVLWPRLRVETFAKNPGGFWQDRSCRNVMIGRADRILGTLKSKVENSGLPEERRINLVEGFEHKHKDHINYITSGETGFCYYLTKFDATMVADRKKSEFLIDKEVKKYEIEQVAERLLKELNSNPDENTKAIEKLNRALENALDAIDSVENEDDLSHVTLDGIDALEVIVPTLAVEKAELMIQKAQEVVRNVDPDGDGFVTEEEKRVPDQAIQEAQSAYDQALDQVSKLNSKNQSIQALQQRLNVLVIPRPLEVAPSTPSVPSEPPIDDGTEQVGSSQIQQTASPVPAPSVDVQSTVNAFAFTKNDLQLQTVYATNAIPKTGDEGSVQYSKQLWALGFGGFLVVAGAIQLLSRKLRKA